MNFRDLFDMILIDDEIAALAMAKLEIGKNVSGVSEGWRYDYPVTLKSFYRFVIQTQKASVGLSISTTDYYMELEAMRVPMSSATGEAEKPARGRGRPPKAATTPAGGTVLPIGSYPRIPAPQERDHVFSGGERWFQDPADSTGQFGYLLPPDAFAAYSGQMAPQQVQQTYNTAVAKANPPVTEKEKKAVTVEMATGDGDHIENALDRIMAGLREELEAWEESIVQSSETGDSQEAPPPQRMSCFECEFADIKNGACAKFNMPFGAGGVPVFVMADAVTNCNDFMLIDTIPF